MNKILLIGLALVLTGAALLAYPYVFSHEKHTAKVGDFKMSVKTPRRDGAGPHPAWGVSCLVAGTGMLGYAVGRGGKR
jgi:hypothetical protein